MIRVQSPTSSTCNENGTPVLKAEEEEVTISHALEVALSNLKKEESEPDVTTKFFELMEPGVKTLANIEADIKDVMGKCHNAMRCVKEMKAQPKPETNSHATKALKLREIQVGKREQTIARKEKELKTKEDQIKVSEKKQKQDREALQTEYKKLNETKADLTAKENLLIKREQQLTEREQKIKPMETAAAALSEASATFSQIFNAPTKRLKVVKRGAKRQTEVSEDEEEEIPTGKLKRIKKRRVVPAVEAE